MDRLRPKYMWTDTSASLYMLKKLKRWLIISRNEIIFSFEESKAVCSQARQDFLFPPKNRGVPYFLLPDRNEYSWDADLPGWLIVRGCWCSWRWLASNPGGSAWPCACLLVRPLPRRPVPEGLCGGLPWAAPEEPAESDRGYERCAASPSSTAAEPQSVGERWPRVGRSVRHIDDHWLLMSSQNHFDSNVL